MRSIRNCQFGRQPPRMESVGRTVDTGNRATDREYARGGRAERMANRSSCVQAFPGLSSGGFEGGLPPTNRLHLLDARRIAAVSEIAVKAALSSGPSVIVGRGSQFFLRDRKDVFHVFLYASRDHKIRRLISRGKTQNKAIELIDTTDKARAAFVRQYLGLKWPEPHLYHAMFNTEMGESCTVTMLVECLRLFQRDREYSQ